jgi:hypothetical protein
MRVNLLASIILGILLIGMTLGLLLSIDNVQAAPLAQDGTRSVLTTTTIILTGITQTLRAADPDGYKFLNDGKTFISVYNAYTDTVTLTFVTPGTVYGLAIADLDVVVPVGQRYMIGPFPANQFNVQSGTDLGYTYLNFPAVITGSLVNSVTVGAFR